MSGSVGLEENDGSWLVLDVAAGRINGVDVAVWPNVRCVAGLTAGADPARRIFHFRLGKPHLARTVRLGRDLLLDVDDRSHITSLWLLNVPPCPAES